MKTCPRCNASIEDWCRFCPNCGASQIVIATGLEEPSAEAPVGTPSEAPPLPESLPAQIGAGGEVPPPLTPQPAFVTPGLLRPALISGLLMGGLSALPIVNACCCLWMIGGGMLASFLYIRQATAGLSGPGMAPPLFTSTEGAKVGLAAGFFGFITGFVIFAFIQRVMLAGRGSFASRFRERIQEALTRQGDVPPETRQFLDWLTTPGGTAFFLVFMITVFFFAFLGLGALGGMLGVNFFGKKPSPKTT